MSYSKDYTITSLSTGITQRTFKNSAVVAPFTLAVNGANSLRATCIPFLPTNGGIPPQVDREDCGIPDITEKLPLIESGGEVWAPETYGATNYTEIVNATVIGTTSTHIGSIYLNSGLINEIGVITCTTEAPVHTNTQIKRFTDNSLLASFEAGAAVCGYSNNLLVTVPTTDWYDIYLSGTLPATTSRIEGIYIEYRL